MSQDEIERWRTKVAAWIHDPAEKALVLFRNPAGHEAGTVSALRHDLFGRENVADDVVKQADRWASAADRPQFPRDAGESFPAWAQVRFANEPVLIHPLSGSETKLDSLIDSAPWQQLEAVSLDHFNSLVQRDDAGAVDWKRTLLALWRFGADTPARDIGALWGLLPADTRVPDHSIWEHLRLVSAFAGALSGGDTPALLSVSIGPVQSFIAQGRSTSDLWAGSHLLSRLAWEAMRPICEALGPDAILMPDLRGVPLVNLWLAEQGIEGATEQEKRNATDANPLFRAALPNHFLALVPASQAAGLLESMQRRVREWMRAVGHQALKLALFEADTSMPPFAAQQIDEQLAEFPEIHWSLVPWPKARSASDIRPDASGLAAALNRFEPIPCEHPGYLGKQWQTLLKAPDGSTFFAPNPGALYPALHDLLDRSLAAHKSLRPFAPLQQIGYRCSLCGEREVLALAAEHRPQYRPVPGSLWAQIADKKPGWARDGARLCALCLVKRLWPRVFAEEITQQVEGLEDLRRYVVSTHTMALAPTLERLLDQGQKLDSKGLKALYKDVGNGQSAALPRRVARRLGSSKLDPELRALVRRMPVYLDDLDENETDRDTARQKIKSFTDDLKKLLGNGDPEGDESTRLESYFAMLLMDGDRLGAWLSGSDPVERAALSSLWHPKVRDAVREQVRRSGADLDAYVSGSAPVSPSYHVAISQALNHFSLDVAPRVVEDLHSGKLIYAGGDDLLAMSSVQDLLSTMLLLRCAYSGHLPVHDQKAVEKFLQAADGRLKLQRGYALIQDKETKLLRMMGERATASIGAVVAHHKAPLGSLMRELREAERRAKSAGRDAFSIALMKRSGGTTYLTLPWKLDGIGDSGATPMGILLRLRDAIGNAVTRRFAYNCGLWLDALPAAVGTAMRGSVRRMIVSNLNHQAQRQANHDRSNGMGAEEGFSMTLCEDLADLALAQASPREALRDLLTVAEFLARAQRGG